MYRRLTSSGVVVEVDQVEIRDEVVPAMLIKITPQTGDRTALVLTSDVAEALMDGLMIETVR